MAVSRFRYPLYLDLVDKPVIVVGAGVVGIRKVETLLEAGALVTAYDPNPHAEMQTLLKKYPQQLIWRAEKYVDQDLNPYLIVIAATSDKPVQSLVEQRAKKLGKLLNVVDVPAKCTFIVPSIYKQGDLQLAISTGGNAPAFSKYLRQKLEKEWGPEYGVLLNQLSAFHEKINRIESQVERRQLWERIFALDPLNLVKAGKMDWVTEVEQWISSATA